MDTYDSPMFRMACQQFDLVADYLQIPENERARLKFPKRSMTVALPIRMDDGSTKVFSGYRVQHHLTLGPTNGGFFWGETEVVDKMFRVFENAWTPILNLSRKSKISMRFAAMSVGVKRVQEAKQMRGLFP